MEKCHYCNIVYHPMMRWTKPGELIYVCALKFTETPDGGLHITPSDECNNKAIADGYTRRPDLTPKR